MLDIQIKKEVDKITYSITGKLNFENDKEFRSLLNDAENDANEVVIDFSNIKYISSIGLGTILRAHKIMKQNNKKLTLINVDPINMEAFVSTGLSKYLNII